MNKIKQKRNSTLKYKPNDKMRQTGTALPSQTNDALSSNNKTPQTSPTYTKGQYVMPAETTSVK